MGRTRTKAADRKQSRNQPPNGLERRASRIEAFFASNLHVTPFTPEEHPETDVAQVQLLLEGQPAYNTRAESKVYMTFLLPQLALQLSDALTRVGVALADREIAEVRDSGLAIAGAGTNVAAMAEQAAAVDALRT